MEATVVMVDGFRAVKTAKDVELIGAYAWPGGYAIYYHTQNGDTLCPDCAKAEFGNGDADFLWITNASDNDDAYNGTGISCDQCNGWIVEHDAEEYAQNFDVDGNDIR